MLVAFTFRARAGQESAFEKLLDDPASGRRVAELMGARRNTLFLGKGRMIRVLEFPEGARPRALADIAREDAAIGAFLRALGPLVEDGFDVDAPGSLDAFNKRAVVPLAYDVRVASG